MDAAGNLYVGDWTANANRICKISRQGTVSTVAGNGNEGYSGDGGPATSASMRTPKSVAADTKGNLYIADTANDRIRKVDLHGIITTVAGNGQQGFSGDGGPALNASLSRPNGVAMDAAGNLYIADTLNHRIRMVSPEGLITTVAGNAEQGFSGDGGRATSASLRHPDSVAVDARGDIYIADTNNMVVRMISPKGVISTVAGNGHPGFFGDGGKATDAALNYPMGIALDKLGNVYIADTLNSRIRKVSTAGVITTVAGNGYAGFSGDGGSPTSASLHNPHSLTVDVDGSLFIADSFNFRVRKVSETSKLQ